MCAMQITDIDYICRAIEWTAHVKQFVLSILEKKMKIAWGFPHDLSKAPSHYFHAILHPLHKISIVKDKSILKIEYC